MFRRFWQKDGDKPARQRRRLAIEQFEPRQLMAIDVALRHDGSLGIEGDGASDDDYAIVGTERAGEITVSGRNGTVVNGVMNGQVTLWGVTSSVWARSNWNTNNRITVDNVYVAGDLQISLPSHGSNAVILGANGVVSTTRSIAVHSTGADNNVVRFENYNVHAGGGIYVDGSSAVGSSDDISLVGASTGLADVNVSLSRGHDALLLDGVTSSGAYWINSVSTVGDNGEKYIAMHRSSAVTFVDIWVVANTQYSSIYLDTCFAGQWISVYGNTGILSEEAGSTGTAAVTIARCEAERIAIRTGFANDFVNLYANNITGPPQTGAGPTQYPHAIYVDTRSGNDDVQMSYNIVHRIVYSALGNGSDTLSAVGNLFDDIAYFNGMVGEHQSGPDGMNLLTLVNNSIAIPAFFHFGNV